VKENWEFSSYKDYYGLRNGSLVNKELALKTICLEEELYNTFEHNFGEFLET